MSGSSSWGWLWGEEGVSQVTDGERNQRGSCKLWITVRVFHQLVAKTDCTNQGKIYKGNDRKRAVLLQLSTWQGSYVLGVLTTLDGDTKPRFHPHRSAQVLLRFCSGLQCLERWLKYEKKNFKNCVSGDQDDWRTKWTGKIKMWVGVKLHLESKGDAGPEKSFLFLKWLQLFFSRL